MIVEILTDEFRFYKNGKPTEHFARGFVIKENSYSKTLIVECLTNGKKYEVNKSDVKVITA